MRLPATTRDVSIPTDPLALVIGQEEATRAVRIAARQRRHLLLVGPPGTGKSMIAQAVACLLPPPKQEVSVLNNPENPERPVVEVREASKLAEEHKRARAIGRVVPVQDVPVFVAERLGFRCRRCAGTSAPSVPVCPACGADKYRRSPSPFDDLLFSAGGEVLEDRVHTTRNLPNGKEELIAYERADGGKVRILTEKEMKAAESAEKRRPRKVLLPLSRSTFVQATGASETELLGDVKHDPYGGHPEAGTAPYLRVVLGAVHEAHEGVLFIDELATLGHLQRFILTAMQEKRFPISGRNATSTGASVRVDNVPCDFILIGAMNTADMSSILPPLRNRIIGDGYEVLLNTTMPDTEENRKKLVQFIAQEIIKDGKIPHADSGAIAALIEEARSRARSIDEKPNALSLRMRGISGLLKLAGDFATLDGSQLITARHVEQAREKSQTIEEQLGARHESWWKAGMSDFGVKRKQGRESEIL